MIVVAASLVILSLVRRPARRPIGRVGDLGPGRRTRGTPSVRTVLAQRVVLAALVAIVAGVVGALFALAIMWLFRRTRGVLLQRAVRRAAAEAAPELLELLVAVIRAGHHPVAAFAVIEPLAPEPLRDACRRVSERQHHGERFADALSELPESLEACARMLGRAERYGEPLAPVLDRLADDARSSRRRAAEASARRLPVRLCFPLATCTLPSFIVLTIVPLLAGTLSSLRLSV